MQKLISGIHKFRQDKLEKYQELFYKLSREGQNPHTLFITCSDSRVLAELITQSQPGDLFVVKNIGNIVPPENVSGSTNSTAAAIEFAVQTLGVKNVVICGHSSCGAMAALLKGLPEKETMPHLNDWLEIASPIREKIERDYSHLSNLDEKMTIAAKENVLFALDNLRTYPIVKKKLAEGSLRLNGWFFKIATVEMFAYDTVSKQFLPIERKNKNKSGDCQ